MAFVTEEDVARLSYAERKMALLSQIWSAITTVRHPTIIGEVIKLLEIAFPQPANDSVPPADTPPAASDALAAPLAEAA